ncbi:MAG: HAMP domain-containing sensor histidine kinase [Psychrobium sp.]
MTQFFFRIFIAIWIILPITAVTTMLTGKLFQHTGWFAEPTDFESVMVEKIVNDINSMPSLSITQVKKQILKRHVLNLEQLIQIYIVDEDGQDILARPLPVAVSRRLNPTLRRITWGDNYVIASVSETAHGLTVIGHKAPYPLIRMIFQPKIRIILWTVMLLVSGIVTWRLARYIVAPLRVLRQASVQVANGNLDIRVANSVENRSDDIALLAQDFDVMTGKLQKVMKSQQRLMRDVSHELRSPLARIQAMISIANQQHTQHQIDLVRIEQELEKLDSLIGDILDFSRIDSMQQLNVQRTDLRELVDVICESAEIEAACEHPRIEITGELQAVEMVDAKLLGSAIENVVRNALKFSPRDEKIHVTINRNNQSIVIDVCDHGPGVPNECLANLFMPFYQVENSVQSRQSSSGVGLSIAQRAIELHRGKISASNILPSGLRVTIEIPC